MHIFEPSVTTKNSFIALLPCPRSECNDGSAQGRGHDGECEDQDGEVNSSKFPHAHEVGGSEQGPSHGRAVPDEVDTMCLNLGKVFLRYPYEHNNV